MELKEKDITNEEFLDYLRNNKFQKIKQKKITYYNIPFSFDIEVSSFYENDIKKATMYAFGIGCNGYVTLGRTWNDFKYLINSIKDILQLDSQSKIIIYVHNLSYEFQFIKMMFNWKNVFCIDDRKVCYCDDGNGIIFKCSYLLSGYKLATLAINLQKYKVRKLEGDLDYSLLRGSNTPLTNKEQQYIINDNLVVLAYIQEEIENNGNILKIPLTKTGYVRRYTRDSCLYEDGTNHKKSNGKYQRYMRIMKQLTLEPKEYLECKKAFHGGFTHGNAIYVDYVMNNVTSMDFTSSYPAVMVSERFPMGKGRYINVNTLEEARRYLDYYCCIFTVYMEDLDSIEAYENILSKSKAEFIEECVTNNGRIVSAKKIQYTTTNVDFEVIEKFYTWSKIEFRDFIIYPKGYLPTDFVKAVLKYYNAKTTLKGVVGKENEYLKGKENVNSCYGMCVTDICRNEIEYNNNGTFSKKYADIEKCIEKYNRSKNRFLSYPWGIFVTAYAFRNLATAIYNLKYDYLYSDTDSVKFLNYEKHKNYFEKYNEIMKNKLIKACEYHKISTDLIHPKTIKGVEKWLGFWDYEGCYINFKYLGAKRYMYYDGEHLSLTVSGINKKTAIPYLLKKNNNDILKCFNDFQDGLEIPKEYSGKKTLTYIDNSISGEFVDYLGNKCVYNELSYIHMENSSYKMSLSEEFIDYLMGVKIIQK